jgi:hypothetical protein
MAGTISQFAGVYHERAPHGVLREHVRCVWVNDLSESENECVRVVPDGCADIIWTGRSLIVAGPDTQSILDRLPGEPWLWAFAFILGWPHRGLACLLLKSSIAGYRSLSFGARMQHVSSPKLQPVRAQQRLHSTLTRHT